MTIKAPPPWGVAYLWGINLKIGLLAGVVGTTYRQWGVPPCPYPPINGVFRFLYMLCDNQLQVVLWLYLQSFALLSKRFTPALQWLFWFVKAPILYW